MLKKLIGQYRKFLPTAKLRNAYFFAGCIWACSGLLSNPLFGQTALRLERFGGPGDENLSVMRSSPDGNLFLAGTFTGDFEQYGFPFSSVGEDDIFLLRFDSTGHPAWQFAGGSTLDDDVMALALGSSRNFFIGGGFWLEASFADTVLRTERNARGLFWLAFNESNQLTGAHVIEGTGLKDITSMAVGPQGELVVGGFFGDTLFVQDTTLVAIGETDLFVLRYDPEGQLLWAQRAGFLEDTRLRALTVDVAGRIYAAGTYNRITQIGNFRLEANTSDEDVFVTRMDPATGAFLWAQKAGGVFDEVAKSIACDSAGNVYVTGSLVGVMRLSTTLSIQSTNGNADGFLFSYDSTGVPRWARPLSGDLLQDASSLLWFDNRLLVGGDFQGSIQFDDFSATAVAGFDAFRITTGTEDGRVNSFVQLSSPGTALSGGVGLGPQGSLLTGGVFTGALNFEAQNISAAGSFDVFFLLPATVSNVAEQRDQYTRVEVFPNPAHRQLWVQTPLPARRIVLCDFEGRQLAEWFANSRPLTLPILPRGVYLLLTYFENRPPGVAKVAVY